jgi:hypothetical protein
MCCRTARWCSNAAGWLVAAISDGWQLHDEAKRGARTRPSNAAMKLRRHRRDRSSVTAG